MNALLHSLWQIAHLRVSNPSKKTAHKVLELLQQMDADVQGSVV
jgi:hypothetical protein